VRTIDEHQVCFGELAGPLVHGARFFDWQLISTQQVADAVEYPFQELVDDDAIPYAPVGLDTTVHRYPTFDDTVTMEVTPSHVGDSSLQLVYEALDGGGERLSTARMTHVTIAPEGGALPLPDAARRRLREMEMETTVEPGPRDLDGGDPESYPIFTDSFRIRSPHIEGSELAYFEEYPRFAGIALESFLEDAGTSLGDLAGDRQPFRLRDWHWEFGATVPFESTLTVESDVRAVTEETVRIEHTFRTGDGANIEGVTDYGCFDRDGEPTTFTDEMLAPFEG